MSQTRRNKPPSSYPFKPYSWNWIQTVESPYSPWYLNTHGNFLAPSWFFSWSQVSLSMCCISGHLPQRNTAVVSFVSSRKAPLCGEVRCVTKLRTVVQQTISRDMAPEIRKGYFFCQKWYLKGDHQGHPTTVFFKISVRRSKYYQESIIFYILRAAKNF